MRSELATTCVGRGLGEEAKATMRSWVFAYTSKRCFRDAARKFLHAWDALEAVNRLAEFRVEDALVAGRLLR